MKSALCTLSFCFSLFMFVVISCVSAQEMPAPSVTPTVEKPVVKAQKESSKPIWLQYNGLDNRKINLSKSNRTNDEIVQWAQGKAVEVLSFDYKNYEERMKGFKPFFSLEGWAEYEDHVTKTSLLKTVVENRYVANSIVSGNVRIIKQKNMGGIYRWLIRVPMIMSFFQEERDGSLSTGASMGGKVILTMQVARTMDDFGNGLIIESWTTSRSR